MAKYRIAEFTDGDKGVFFVERQTFIEVEFLKFFTKNKIVWQPIEGQPENGFSSIEAANNFILEYKKTLPKYHYIK